MKQSKKEKLMIEMKLRERELAVVKREYKLQKEMNDRLYEMDGYLKRMKKLENEIDYLRRKFNAS